MFRSVLVLSLCFYAFYIYFCILLVSFACFFACLSVCCYCLFFCFVFVLFLFLLICALAFYDIMVYEMFWKYHGSLVSKALYSKLQINVRMFFPFFAYFIFLFSFFFFFFFAIVVNNVWIKVDITRHDKRQINI